MFLYVKNTSYLHNNLQIPAFDWLRRLSAKETARSFIESDMFKFNYSQLIKNQNIPTKAKFMKVSLLSRRIGVYAGSFDPITNGHQWVIREGARLFDELVVAVGVNPAKKGLFSVEERLAQIRDAVSDLPNVRVTEFHGSYLVHYAMDQGATHILRGLRGSGDLESELMMR